MEREDFCKRLAQLRINKGVSARDMSLSIGQSPNYPSMETFFYICDYFEITPKEFFDLESSDPTKASDLMDVIKVLPGEQIDLLIALGKAIRK